MGIRFRRYDVRNKSNTTLIPEQAMTEMNRAWTLASRPSGEPTAEDFKLVESPVPEPKHGEVLFRTLYLSLDPYMRGRMRGGPSYAAALEVGGVINGEVVARLLPVELLSKSLPDEA